MNITDITPYTYKKIGLTTFIIMLNGDDTITVEYSNEEYVKKFVNYLNGAFREGMIFGSFNLVVNEK